VVQGGSKGNVDGEAQERGRHRRSSGRKERALWRLFTDAHTACTARWLGQW
jgi:hypothetical protein